jgi:hypothetical protein
VEWPAQPIRAWLAILAEPLARYDNPVVLEALGGAMSAPIFCGLVSAAGDWLVLHVVARKRVECGLWGCKPLVPWFHGCS